MSKVIIITGASRGIGLAIARSLLKSSHRVVLTARSEDELAKVKAANPGKVEYVAGDITNPEVRDKGRRVLHEFKSQDVFVFQC